MVQALLKPGRREESNLAPHPAPPTEGRYLMGRRLLLVAPMLFAVLVVSGVALVLSACGGGDSAQQKAKAKEGANARHLPPFEAPLRPGEYRSEKFKPSYSFTVGKGWANNAQELPDFIELERQGEPGYLRFANIKEVYEPGTQNVVEAPKDLVGWFQNHPYLKTDEPEPITVGGVEGEQIDVLVEDLPQDFLGRCGVECVDIAPLSGGEQSVFFKEANKRRVIVLQDVKDEMVTIDFSSPVVLFDKFASEAQKVVDTVKWEGS
jgi:hypothetical protein